MGFGKKTCFRLISHEGGLGLYVLPACDLMDGEFLLLFSHKSQEELKVEKRVSVSWDVNDNTSELDRV